MVIIRYVMHFVMVVCLLLVSASAAWASNKFAHPHGPGYLGLLIPVGPAHYGVIFKNFVKIKDVRIGHFNYQVGNIYNIPVIICIQPFGGEFTRALTAQVMVDNFDIKALLYPGTSGAHVPPGKMHVGDIVVGTKQVNFANFYMSPAGVIVPDEFSGKSSLKDYEYFYLNRKLEEYAACAAKYVANREILPHWLNGKFKYNKPEIYYYGIQGTSSMWLADKSFIAKTDKVFHEVDEDGDWYSATVAKMADIPFIEVSTISDSVYEFKGNGVPPRGKHQKSASEITQNISDLIMLRIIKIYGEDLLDKKYNYPSVNPYPAYFYQTPKDPHGLLVGCKN